MDFVATKPLKLAAFVAFGSQLDIEGFILDMVQAPFSPNLTTVDADLTLANFVGYAFCPSDPAPFTSYLDTLRAALVMQANPLPATKQTEKAGAIVAPQTMYGYCLHGGTTTNLLATAVFDPPIPIEQTGDGAVFPLEFLAFSTSWMV